MNPLQRKLGIVLAISLLLGSTLFLSAPSLIRWYVTRTYPFVTLEGDIQIGLDGVRFWQVGITRPGLKASLSEVQVDFQKNIRIHGGRVNLDLDSQNEKSEGFTDRAQDLRGAALYLQQADGLIAEVKKGDLTASVNGLRVDKTQACFGLAKIIKGQLHLQAHHGCVQRDKSAVSAEQVEVPIKLPFKIPRVATEHTIVVMDAHLNVQDNLLRFASAKLGPFEVVGPATVKLSESTVFLDAPRINVDHPWVAPYPAFFKELSVTAPLGLLKGEGGGKLRLRVGKATIFVDPKSYAIDGEADCGDWMDILPHPLPEVLPAMEGHYSGRLSFEVRTKPIPYLKIQHNCKYACSEEPFKSLRKGTFSYQAYDKSNNLFERQSGPNSAGWVSISDLPPQIPRAFITLEDPGFYSHRGIHVQALENSLKMNLATGRFVRGGSTISMQLAKNLWLKRHKTVGRKAYEALLTVALESCLSKAEILEMYMNVVEYGPDLYGIGPATKHYFSKPAQQLELDEAFYLASILPRPKKAIHPKDGGMDRVHNLMKALANSGLISEYLVPIRDSMGTDDWDVDE